MHRSVPALRPGPTPPVHPMTASDRSPDRRTTTAALLLAIDALPAAPLRSLVHGGRLRQMARLARMGVLADWQTPVPADERGAHWLSAVTGQALAAPHGGRDARIVLARDLTVSPLWDWADAVGRPCRVLGWPGAIGGPEQAVPGLPAGALRVAEPRHWPAINAQGLPLLHDAPAASALCWPASQRTPLQQQQVLPEEVPVATLRQLLPWRPLPGADSEAATFALERAARRLAAHWLSVLAVGGAWCARPDNALNLLRFDGLASYTASLRRWAPGADVTALLQPWLLWLDELLGTLIEELQGAQADRHAGERSGGDTVLAILAETSPRPAALSQGLLLMCGPGMPAGLRLTQPVALADIAPTLARQLGLPHPPALHGRDLMTQLAWPRRGPYDGPADDGPGDPTPPARTVPDASERPARPQAQTAHLAAGAPVGGSWMQRLLRQLAPGPLGRSPS